MITQATIDQLKEHFGHRTFTGKDIAAYLELPDYRGSGGMIKFMNRQHLVTRTVDGYQFVNGMAPAPAEPAPAESFIETPELTTTAIMIKVSGYYISPRTILIVDTLQEGKVVIHTSILEIDGETKHPRNKKLTFTRPHAPDEYRAIMAWLHDNSTTPDMTSADAHAAIQLAEEAGTKLRDAQEEIKTLKSKIAQFRALLGDV